MTGLNFRDTEHAACKECECPFTGPATQKWCLAATCQDAKREDKNRRRVESKQRARRKARKAVIGG